MVWTAAILPCLWLASSQDAKVIDFETKAASLGQVLEKLSAQTGAKVKASPKIAHEIVFVRAKGVKLSELKAKLAQAIAGTWIEEGDTEYLSRGTAQEGAIWNEHVSLRRKYVDEALSEAKKTLEKPVDAKALAEGLAALPAEPDVSDPLAARQRYARQEALFARGPLSRLLYRLVLACSPNDLAAIGPYERTVFTANPTRMQRGLDQTMLKGALAALAAEQQAWSSAAAKTTFPEDKSGRVVSDPRIRLQAQLAPTTFTLEIRRSEVVGLFHANLVGDTGSAFGRRIMAQASFADPARRFLVAQATAATSNVEDPVVELSEDSKEFSKSLQASVASSLEPLSPRMRLLMLGVEKNDPLAWNVSDALLAYATSKGVNVVAALPDSALSIALYVSREQPLRAMRFVGALVDSATASVTERDGWTIIAPVDRFEAAIDFTPRAAAATLVKAVLGRGTLDVRDYARYAFQSKRLNRGGIGDWFLPLIDRSVLGASDRTDWNSLRLYGSFTAQQQRDLEAGVRFPYAGMNSEQRKIIERIVYAGEIRSEVQTGGGSSTLSNSPVEPTEAFPLGVPPLCTVTARVESVPTIVAYGRGEDGKIRPLRGLNTYTVAAIEADALGDPQKMARYGVTNLAGYAPGADKMVALRLELAPGVWKETAITVADYDLGATPVPWARLPDPYPKQIEEAIALAKAQKANPPAGTKPPE